MPACEVTSVNWIGPDGRAVSGTAVEAGALEVELRASGGRVDGWFALAAVLESAAGGTSLGARLASGFED